MALHGARLLSILLLSSFLNAQAGRGPTTPRRAGIPAPPASQQAQAKSDQPSTVLRVTTRLVVVDVIASDGHSAVSNLKRENFTLLEDGKKQEVRVFTFQSPQSAGSSSALSKDLHLPPHVVTNIPTYDPRGTLNVVLLDGLNTSLPNQAFARQQMIKCLNSIPEGQPIAVYVLGTKLRLVQDFTTDVRALKEAIAKLKGETSPLVEDPLGPAAWTLDTSGRPKQQMIEQVIESWERERASFETDIRIRYTLDALAALARMVSGYPGRKNLIWVSETFPIGIAPDPNLGLYAFDSMRSYDQELTAAAETLMDAQVAVYPVDARGLTTSLMFESTADQINPAPAAIGRPSQAQRRVDDETSTVLSSQATMRDIAGLTGGKAYYNRNDLDGAIRNSIEDGSTYYTLAYYPSNKEWNGKFRKIEVRVNRAGIKLRHRTGYYALDPRMNKDSKPLYAAFGQALSLDTPIATGLRFEAGIVEPSPKSQNIVMVNFAVDPHGVSFEKQKDEKQHASVDCAVQAFTDKGKPIKTEGSTVNPALSSDEYVHLMRGLLYCHQAIELPPGNYVLRLGVLDDHTGLIGTTNARVTVASTSAETPNKSEEKKP